MSTFSSNLADAKRSAEAILKGLDESDLSLEERLRTTAGADDSLSLDSKPGSRSRSPDRPAAARIVDRLMHTA